MSTYLRSLVEYSERFFTVRLSHIMHFFCIFLFHVSLCVHVVSMGLVPEIKDFDLI